MTPAELGIPDVEVLELAAHADHRGYFSEIMRASDYALGFVQSNHSYSRSGVLRGLHYHRYQADLWYVVAGSARVGLADLRLGTGKPPSASLVLEGDVPRSLLIPPGVAHGFYAITDVHLIYWVSKYYDATDEHGIAWNEPMIDIDWGTDAPELSERDQNNPSLQWNLIPSFS
jgi:dTDP-4-dehydrorhamnose 3,5-epimerase